jgi:predicted SAM-dependent methyltransferase
VLPLRASQNGLHLHLGCGDKYIPGFVNIDGNCFRRLDLWIDIRNGLPFPDGIVDGIYTSQTLEHLFPDELWRVLAECYRVLKPCGGMRISVPNLKNAVVAYTNQDASWFGNWPREYASLGGRFSNFIFCDGQHRNAFDFDYFQELLSKVGFSRVEEEQNGRSRLYSGEILGPCEPEPFPDLTHSLYIEAFK